MATICRGCAWAVRQRTNRSHKQWLGSEGSFRARFMPWILFHGVNLASLRADCREAGIDLSVVSPVRLGRELCGLLRMDRRGNIPLIDDQEYGKNCESYSQAIQHKRFKDNDSYRRDYCVQV